MQSESLEHHILFACDGRGLNLILRIEGELSKFYQDSVRYMHDLVRGWGGPLEPGLFSWKGEARRIETPVGAHYAWEGSWRWAEPQDLPREWRTKLGLDDSFRRYFAHCTQVEEAIFQAYGARFPYHAYSDSLQALGALLGQVGASPAPAEGHRALLDELDSVQEWLQRISGVVGRLKASLMEGKAEGDV